MHLHKPKFFGKEFFFVSEESETTKVDLWTKEYGSIIPTEWEYLHFLLQGRQQNPLKQKLNVSIICIDAFI